MRAAARDGLAQVRVRPGVPRHEVAQAEQVRDDLDLAAAQRPAPMPIVGMRSRS
jgi:hypothetical protein